LRAVVLTADLDHLRLLADAAEPPVCIEPIG
jgi:hypothetical protein